MSYTVERDWVTASGLRAVCIICDLERGPHHRCGYVGVPADHPLFGKGYSEQLPAITQEQANTSVIGNKSPLLLLTAGVGADAEGEVRRSLDVVIDVHGGLTYGAGNGKYPVEAPLWWFGFDCSHAGDGEITPDLRWPNHDPVRSLCYVEKECERLAAQLKEFDK